MSYEADLLNAEKQTKSMKNLLNYLDASEIKLDTKLQKIVKGQLSDSIENFSELKTKLINTRFKKYLENL
jgi:hypothetical protein